MTSATFCNVSIIFFMSMTLFWFVLYICQVLLATDKYNPRYWGGGLAEIFEELQLKCISSKSFKTLHMPKNITAAQKHAWDLRKSDALVQTNQTNFFFFLFFSWHRKHKKNVFSRSKIPGTFFQILCCSLTSQ